MSGYRFCRSDDVRLLVRAYNECRVGDDPDLAPWSVDDFRDAVRRLDIWTSSCMVATEGDRLIGVLLAAKREDEGENLVYTIGTHPDFRRQGHARHLMMSLCQKLAILGPRRILAEVPADLRQACAFVESCGYVRQRVFTDFIADQRPDPPAGAELVAAVTLDELLEHDAIDATPGRCWERSRASLLKRREQIRGLAIASDQRIEAYLLYDEPSSHGALQILGCGCARDDRREVLISLLLSACLSRSDGPVIWRRVDRQEIGSGPLKACGFRAATQTIGYAVDAGAV